MNPLTHNTDAELLALLAKDDERAFTTLYERYWQKLFVIAQNRLQDSNAAEDIVHDVFAGLWANRHDTAIENTAHYLAVAVKYAVLNRIKKDIREREKREAALREKQTVESLLAEPALDHKNLLGKIRKEVESLPESCRLIFLYSREAGLPVKEIARRLQLSPKTVENQLGKALKRLKLAVRSFMHFLS